MLQVALADSFIDALAHLDAGDTKRAAAFVSKLVEEPARASFNFEIVHDAHDRSIRSTRVTRDLRAIAHLDDERVLLLFVGRHDVAYDWARTRCLECHPVTGELQIVETPDAALATLAERHGTNVSSSAGGARLAVAGVFDEFSDEYLLSLGVPPSWLATIRMIRSDEAFLSVAGDLPNDVAERLMLLMEGDLVSPPAPVCEDECTWTTPGARRWICTVTEESSLCELLDDAGIDHGLPH
jgi:mRNA-degrading endonuclease RelE of RelBE toxin-antitoxin system